MSTGVRSALAMAFTVVAVLASIYGFFFYRDNFATHFPIKVLSAQAFRAGEIPYWNFADGGGQPLAGNPNTLTFYPDNVLYLVLPAHVAFNLHFWIHLFAAFFIVRALTRSEFAAAMYAISGIAISATAFYNLIVAVAMIPLAFLGVQRRSAPLLGCAFGLLALAGEPVVIIGTAMAVGIVAVKRMPFRRIALAIVIAVVIASPLFIAYAEIAREVERSVSMSSQTVLNASLPPIRIVELFVGPIIGVLNDPGDAYRMRLFSTIFLGLIVAPALLQRSRYVLVAAVMLFFALGRYNPIVAFAVDHVAAIRIVRFPEKLALPMTVAIIVLVAGYYERSRYKRMWVFITLIPLLYVAVRALPIDWFSYYGTSMHPPLRTYISPTISAGKMPARVEYRLRALADEPLFGATEGLRYVINPSVEGMHSLRTRMVVERLQRGVRQPYLRIAQAFPSAFFPQSVAVAHNIYAEAAATEHIADLTTVIAPHPTAVAAARVLAYEERGQRITIDVEARQQSLLFVNQTYFSAWDARAVGRILQTLPLDVDRLGIIVPAGTSRIDLRFGRRHVAVAIAWITSSLFLMACLLVEIFDRRAGEVQRPGDEDGALL